MERSNKVYTESIHVSESERFASFLWSRLKLLKIRGLGDASSER